MGQKSCAIVGMDVAELNYGIDEEDFNCIKLKLAIAKYVQMLYKKGYTDFYINCEFGISLWTGEIILEMMQHADIQLYCIQPYENQVSKWSEEQRNRFFRLHECSTASTLIQKEFTSGCYRKCNEYMVKCTQLITIIGGERKYYNNIIQQAKADGKSVIYFDPDSFQIRKLL